ncbi:MAG: PQQ-binding-like beta-propeller repeat protein [Verrucomicrobiales bacterium]|nr:PQQ-binding-like beta-propeller repeat protein [Verrucomicrobiales bacterium]
MKRQLLVIMTALASCAGAADWPQYRGPNHDGSTPERILTVWPKDGPRVLWRAPLGPSFGAFAVSGSRAFAFIQRPVDGADREVAVAFDADTGRELWAVPLGPPTYDKQGGDGPRSTPTVDGDRVYFLGAHLTLSCLDAATGKVLWQHDLVKKFNGRVLRWNSAASPVLDGDRIFVNAGGPGQAFLAFDKRDGRLLWKHGDDKPTHATPVPATIHGVRQIIFFTQSGLVSLDPEGRELWRYSFPYQTSTAASPVVWQDIVYCSAGYGVGAGAVRVQREGARFRVTELWRHPGRTMSHWSTPVARDGHLYGLIGFKEFGTGPLKCIELATGAEKWSQAGFGSGGATVLVGEHVLVQSDRGPLVLVAAQPDGYREVARAQVLGGKCWTMPAISNGRLYARNTKEGVCLDVKPGEG